MRRTKPNRVRLVSTALVMAVVGSTVTAHAGPDFHGVNERPKRRLLSHVPPSGLTGGTAPSQTWPGSVSRTTLYPGGDLTAQIPDQNISDFRTPGLDGTGPLVDLGDTVTLPGGVYGGPSQAPVPTPGVLPVLVIGALCLKRRRR